MLSLVPLSRGHWILQMGIYAGKHEGLIAFADGLIFFLLDTGGVEEKSAALSAAC